MLLAGRPTRLSDLVREPAALDEARRRAGPSAPRPSSSRGARHRRRLSSPSAWPAGRFAVPPARPQRRCCCVPALKPTVPRRRTSASTSAPRSSSTRCWSTTCAPSRASRSIPQPWRTWPARPTASTPTPCMPRWRTCARRSPTSRSPRLVATFSYAKLPMVADLAAQGASLADHDVVAALAGDPAPCAPSAPRCRTASPTRTPPASTSSSTPTPPSRPPSTRCAVAPTWSSRGRPAPASRRRSPTSSPRWQARARSSSSPRSGRPSTPSSPAWREWACPTSSSTPTTVPPTSGGSRRSSAPPRARSAAEDPDTSAVERTVERRDRLVGHARALHEPRAPWGERPPGAGGDRRPRRQGPPADVPGPGAR